MELIKIGLIEDDENTLNLYKAYINNSDKLECILGVKSVERFLKYIDNFKDLEILLLDIELPGMSGIEAISKIKYKLPELEIIMFTSFGDEISIFNAIRSGASGYLLKNLSQYELQHALLAIKKEGTAALHRRWRQHQPQQQSRDTAPCPWVKFGSAFFFSFVVRPRAGH